MSEERNGTELTVVSWGPAFALAIAAACGLAQLLPEPGGVSAAPAGYRWVTHANTALAGAAAVYLVHYWLGVERVGQAASLLAASDRRYRIAARRREDASAADATIIRSGAA